MPNTQTLLLWLTAGELQQMETSLCGMFPPGWVTPRCLCPPECESCQVAVTKVGKGPFSGRAHCQPHALRRGTYRPEDLPFAEVNHQSLKESREQQGLALPRQPSFFPPVLGSDRCVRSPRGQQEKDRSLCAAGTWAGGPGHPPRDHICCRLGGLSPRSFSPLRQGWDDASSQPGQQQLPDPQGQGCGSGGGWQHAGACGGVAPGANRRGHARSPDLQPPQMGKGHNQSLQPQGQPKTRVVDQPMAPSSCSPRPG